MSQPLSISDRQLDAIFAACQPLAPLERSALLAALSHRLRGYRDVGDGELHRLIRELLHEIWKPPAVKQGPMLHRQDRNIGPAIP